MTRKEKNYNYFKIVSRTLSWYKDKADWNYFQLSYDEAFSLHQIAQACNIKPRKGWSHARTLWERVYEGRPF